MKNRNLFSTLSVVAVMILAACNPLGKMIKKAGEVSYEVTPNPLEMHGDTVRVAVKGKYPAKYFHKKAILDVQPVMKSADGNVIKAFKTVTLVGEVADAEGTKISYTGGDFSANDALPYENAMEVSTFELKITGRFKSKSKEFPDVKVCDATIVTPLLVMSDDKPLIGADKFQRIIPKSANAEINYLVNSWTVRPGELRDDDIKALKAFVDEGLEKGWNWKGLSNEAYASPEGEIALNENLANDRAKAGAKAIGNILKKAKIEAAKEEGFYNNVGKGEDWDGFKQAMQASEIADKDLILKVLSMYSDLNQREQEIKNMAETYLEIKDKILPDLRRTQITLNAEEVGKSDDEIKALANSSPDSLTVEELLYAGTLFDNMDSKLKVYQSAERVYANDWRSHNNTGMVLLMQNKLDEAVKHFSKAAELSANNPVVNNNLGICARLQGDRKKAMSLYQSATAAGSEVKYNMGIINIQDGQYETAIGNFGSNKTFNSALAKMLNGDTDGSLKDIEASSDKSTAMGYYLKAIVGARTKNKDMVQTNLKSALSTDGSLKAKAQKDLEFRDYKDVVDAL